MQMSPSGFNGTSIVSLLIIVNLAFVVFLVARPGMKATLGGKVLAFLALFFLPLLAGYGGVYTHLEHSKQTEFCLSCHVMQDYGRSLHIDDPAHIPAVHFQNNLVPRDQACFTCHTDYTLYGGVNAKLRGLKHLYVYYLGTVPEKPVLYSPYQNRECLHCHAGSRSFEENPMHSLDAAAMTALRSGEVSCLVCHDSIHDVEDLGQESFWEPPVVPHLLN